MLRAAGAHRRRAGESLQVQASVTCVCECDTTPCRCGFSNTVVQILNACETPFETFDVLGDQRVPLVRVKVVPDLVRVKVVPNLVRVRVGCLTW